MAARLRVPRRGAAATGPVGGAACGAAVRDRLVFLCGDGGAGASACRSWREDALRFRDEDEPGGCSGVPDSGGSVASLAEERVVLDDMRKYSFFFVKLSVTSKGC